MSFLVTSPLPIFEDVDGQPLENGMIYIGTVNLNPQSNPVAVYWDAALTQPAAQPIRTSGGFPARSGTPARVYTASSYSIMVTNSKGELVFSELSAGVSSLVSWMFSGVITDLNFDPTLLGMVDAEVRLLVTNSSPSNKPAGADTGTYYLITLAKVSSSEYRLQMTQSGSMGSILTRYYSSGVWSSWNANGDSPLVLANGSSPYTIVAGATPTIMISATTNPFVVNLPDATGCNGCKLTIENSSQSITGIVEVVPFTGQSIANLVADESIFLQNVDQSASAKSSKSVTLMANSARSTWDYVSGELMPEQTVDANGAQYYFGKLIRLPTRNSTARGATIVTPAAGAWSAAIRIGGLTGVPSKAVGVLLRFQWRGTSAAAGLVGARFTINDNNTFSNDARAPYPVVSSTIVATAGAQNVPDIYQDITVPLNSSGDIYVHTDSITNSSVNTIDLVVQGYYMGF